MIKARQKLIDECYKRSKALLLKNATKYGVMAARDTAKAIDKRYDYIFGRDASICALGMIASGDKKLIKLARVSLKTLARHQTKLGEIPYSTAPSHNKNLFYHLGSIDSTLWWLIAIDFYNKYSGDKKLKILFSRQIKKGLRWLFYQDQNNDGLLEQGEASDWADYMPNNGMVLYTNVLWLKVLSLYGYKKDYALAIDGLNNIFLPHKAKPKQSKYISREIHHYEMLNIIKEIVEDTPYYLHYISFRQASDRCDVYSNSLAIILGLTSPARSQSIIRFMRNARVNEPYPAQALYPPIEKGDFDWRDYLEWEDSLNKPYQYHNGGIWPFIGAFWVMSLKKAGKKELAWQELARVAEANKINKWEFNEWFHGKTGKPMGMPGQSWNAGTFLLAYHYINNNIDL